MKIKTEKEFRAYQAEMESLIAKGTALGDMELLDGEDKTRYVALSEAINKWEAAYHSLPGKGFNLDYRCCTSQNEGENPG